jgi:hypothetical protein
VNPPPFGATCTTGPREAKREARSVRVSPAEFGCSNGSCSRATALTRTAFDQVAQGYRDMHADKGIRGVIIFD